jgi:hypothetical protein
MTEDINITTEQREMLLAFLRRHLPGVAVWAYGSRVKFTAHPYSDLDLVCSQQTSPDLAPPDESSGRTAPELRSCDAQRRSSPHRQPSLQLRVFVPPREPSQTMSLNESIVEDAALEWFLLRSSPLNYGGQIEEPCRVAQTLTRPLPRGQEEEREAIRRLNPAIPKEASACALRADRRADIQRYLKTRFERRSNP